MKEQYLIDAGSEGSNLPAVSGANLTSIGIHTSTSDITTLENNVAILGFKCNKRVWQDIV